MKIEAVKWGEKSWVVTIDGNPVGATLSEAEAKTTAQWLHGAQGELWEMLHQAPKDRTRGGGPGASSG